ncbi:hypothetical protein CRG98_022214 [Punica granatum]|uniref:Uncharacterized protein n=1 Tax=Punica granatum TaxID=22663 RepID=A0A2I0JM67_PUNGR|nr:hypothetical protein CRG98_022214 [Punica granatum]
MRSRVLTMRTSPAVGLASCGSRQLWMSRVPPPLASPSWVSLAPPKPFPNSFISVKALWLNEMELTDVSSVSAHKYETKMVVEGVPMVATTLIFIFFVSSDRHLTNDCNSTMVASPLIAYLSDSPPS